MAKTYIAYGVKEVDTSVFGTIGAGIGLKPIGGLCGYEYIKGEYSSAYEQWCEEEKIDRGSLRYGITFHIDTDKKPRIRTVAGWADLHSMLSKFPLISTVDDEDGRKSIVDISIDYEKARAKYDIIEFTFPGIANTSLEEKHVVDLVCDKILQGEQKEYLAPRLYEINTCGWECPCICILNEGYVKDVEFVRNGRDYEMNQNEVYDEVKKEMDSGAGSDEIVSELMPYCHDREMLLELINDIKDTKKNDIRFQKMITSLEALLGFGQPNALKDEITSTTKEIYNMSPMKREFDEFSSILSNILTGKVEKGELRQGKAQAIEESMLNALGVLDGMV